MNYAAELISDFERFISQPSYPCLGAKSALGKNLIEYIIARDIQSAWDDLPIIEALANFAAGYTKTQTMFQSLVVIFESNFVLTEEEFEHALWDRLQSLHDKDEFHGFTYDGAVTAEPGHPEFSLSFGGQAFFAVGLHPGASRKARRFSRNAIVFNLHDQFERLRTAGKYQRMREKILKRDENWSGSINPMLAVHGSISEARQYSGREVAEDWQCPFRPHRLQNFAPGYDPEMSDYSKHRIPTKDIAVPFVPSNSKGPEYHRELRDEENTKPVRDRMISSVGLRNECEFRGEAEASSEGCLDERLRGIRLLSGFGDDKDQPELQPQQVDRPPGSRDRMTHG